MHRLLSTQAISVLIATSFIVLGCERAGPLEPDPPGDEAKLSVIQTRIFDVNCALSGCHGGGSPQLGLNLSTGQAYGSLVNVASVEQALLMRVDPADPENSYLLRKIRGDAGITGARMPLGRPALSAEDIELVRQWIDDGARDN